MLGGGGYGGRVTATMNQSVSASVSVEPPDIFEESSGHVAAMFVATKVKT